MTSFMRDNYGMEASIPVKLRSPLRRELLDTIQRDEAAWIKLDLVEEAWEIAQVGGIAANQQITRHFNQKSLLPSFQKGRSSHEESRKCSQGYSVSSWSFLSETPMGKT